MDTQTVLDYIYMRYGVDITQPVVEIPNTTRDTLAKLFKDLGYKKGAEIGVERGKYSEVLCRENPDLTLYAIDAWTAYDGYRDHIDQNFVNTLQEEAVARLAPYNAVLIKGFSEDPAILNQFADASLDFVYIDGNHEFQHVANDICNWSKKVKPGGIVAGDDYIKRRSQAYLMHVPMVLHAFAESYEIKPVFILGRKRAQSNTDPAKGELRNSTRSWFYIKPAPLPYKPGYKGS